MSEKSILDTLLDGTLDDLADAPTFEPFKVGAHRVIIEFEGHEKPLTVNNHPCMKLNLKLINTEELADASDTPQLPGSETSVLYFMDNEMGQGAFKKLLLSLSEHFKTTNNRETVEASKDAECLVVTTQKPNKTKTGMFTDVKEISVI